MSNFVVDLPDCIFFELVYLWDTNEIMCRYADVLMIN